MKLIVVGGVAGGASAAARARRLDENAEIVMFERGGFISFANCGLPYHVGNVIPERSSLLLMTPEKFKARTAIDVRILHEVTGIAPDRKVVTVHNLHTGESFEESYDKLILATGASPIRPPIPGIDDPDVLQLWTIPDMDRIRARIDDQAKRAVVVGAGFVGLEIAENLRERGLEVDLVEMLPQVLPTLDAEMANPLAAELSSRGIRLHLNRKVTRFERKTTDETVARELRIHLDDDEVLTADFAVLSVGVRPNSDLATAAGLAVGERGGIKVDAYLRTSDPDIYAVGDVDEVTDLIRERAAQIPLAGPANRQGRLAADNACGREKAYRGTLGTSVVKVFRLTAASTGATERTLKQDERRYQKIYIHPQSHAGYYPGAVPLHLKLLFNDEGKILGCQIVGRDGVDKRIDVIATAILGGMTVDDLEGLELAYSPPYGSAKDPVNFAGMVAANVLRGDSRLAHCDDLPEGAFLLDVREPDEYSAGHLNGSALIPLGTLRDRIAEIPRDRPVVVYCKVGLRGYLAERILQQEGFDVRNLSGGWTTHLMCQPPVGSGVPPTPSTDAPPQPTPPKNQTTESPDRRLDVQGLQCPGPIVQTRRELDGMQPGQTLLVLASEPGFARDIVAWCKSTGHDLVRLDEGQEVIEVVIRKRAAGPAPGAASGPPADAATIVLFSGDLDKALAGFILANGFASLGMKVNMFFTFWGLNVLRKDHPPKVKKDLLSRMFGFMMPRGARKLALSKMHMLGMGTGMMRHVMRQKMVLSLPELIAGAKAQGVRFVACDMAMNVMGMQRTELLDSVDEVAGVASFAGMAQESGPTLFI